MSEGVNHEDDMDAESKKTGVSCSDALPIKGQFTLLMMSHDIIHHSANSERSTHLNSGAIMRPDRSMPTVEINGGNEVCQLLACANTVSHDILSKV